MFGVFAFIDFCDFEDFGIFMILEFCCFLCVRICSRSCSMVSRGLFSENGVADLNIIEKRVAHPQKRSNNSS